MPSPWEEGGTAVLAVTDEGIVLASFRTSPPLPPPESPNAVLPPPEEGGRGVGNDRIVSVYAPARFFGLSPYDFVPAPFLRMTRGWLLPCI